MDPILLGRMRAEGTETIERVSGLVAEGYHRVGSTWQTARTSPCLPSDHHRLQRSRTLGVRSNEVFQLFQATFLSFETLHWETFRTSLIHPGAQSFTKAWNCWTWWYCPIHGAIIKVLDPEHNTVVMKKHLKILWRNSQGANFGVSYVETKQQHEDYRARILIMTSLIFANVHYLRNRQISPNLLPSVTLRITQTWLESHQFGSDPHVKRRR